MTKILKKQKILNLLLFLLMSFGVFSPCSANYFNVKREGLKKFVIPSVVGISAIVVLGVILYFLGKATKMYQQLVYCHGICPNNDQIPHILPGRSNLCPISGHIV